MAAAIERSRARRGQRHRTVPAGRDAAGYRGEAISTIHQTTSEGQDQDAFYFVLGSTADRVKIRSQSQFIGVNANGNFVLGVDEKAAQEFEAM